MIETKRRNLHVLDEFVGTANVSEAGESDLSDNSAELAGSSRDTVSGGTVTGREDFSRNDEGSGVGAKVLEEVGQAVEEDESLLCAGGSGELVISEAHDDKRAGEHTETEKLNGFASPRVDEKEGDP